MENLLYVERGHLAQFHTDFNMRGHNGEAAKPARLKIVQRYLMACRWRPLGNSHIASIKVMTSDTSSPPPSVVSHGRQNAAGGYLRTQFRKNPGG